MPSRVSLKKRILVSFFIFTIFSSTLVQPYGAAVVQLVSASVQMVCKTVALIRIIKIITAKEMFAKMPEIKKLLWQDSFGAMVAS